MQILQLVFSLLHVVFFSACLNPFKKNPMLNIRVYSGPGTSSLHVESTFDTLNHLLSSRYIVQQVTAKDLISPNWMSSTSLLVFPGGQASPYLEELSGIPVSNIREYINRGGSYLGFGAGAYFASKRVEFMLGTPLERAKDLPLEFFPGVIQGTTFPGFDYASDKGALATNITFSFPGENKTIQSLAYYNGGGSFLKVESFSNIEVLAKYNDITDKLNENAVILCHVGKGKALLSSIHTEYFPAKPIHKFYNELLPYKTTLEHILREWFHILNLESNYIDEDISRLS